MQTDIHVYNNTTHYEIRHSVVILVAKILLVELVITIVHIFVNNLILSSGFHDSIMKSFSGQIWELLIFHTVTTVAILYFVLQWVTTYYVITNKEIVHETWIMARKRSSYDLPGIQEIDSVQWFWWRICGYGDIILENPLISSRVYLKNVPNPDHYAKLIKIVRDANMQNKWHDKIIPIIKTA